MRYRVYGGVLQSDVAFPELTPANDHVFDWQFARSSVVPEQYDLVPLGERRAGRESYVLSRMPDGFRLEYSHAGTFDVRPQRRTITWYPSDESSEELARAIVIGPAFALLLEAAGDVCLHGSAVVVRDGALAFLGPKHHGKSTLALALTAAGCRLLSDDLVAVTPGSPATMRPAVPSMRLWADSASQLQPSQLCDTIVPGVKHTLGGFAAEHVAAERVGVASIYVLAPVAADERREASRRRLSGAEAVVAIAQQKKLADALVGYADAGNRLPHAAALAAAVPVYELQVPRDFAVLARVVEQILGWHGGTPDGHARMAREG